MKKRYFSLIAALIIFTAAHLTATGQTAQVKATATMQPGHIMALTVTAQNLPPVNAISITLVMDSNVIWTLQSAVTPLGGIHFYSKGRFIYSWYSFTPSNGDTLIKALFRCNIYGSTQIIFDPQPGANEINGAQAQILPCTFLGTFVDVTPLSILSGRTLYGSSAGAPLGSATVILTGAFSQKTYQTTSDTGGNYTLQLPNDAYFVNCYVTDSTPASGINAADALMAEMYFVKLINLDSLQQLTGDIDRSGSINSTDAVLIANWFVNGQYNGKLPYFINQNSFNKVALNGNTQKDFIIIKAGDLNKSYIPIQN